MRDCWATCYKCSLNKCDYLAFWFCWWVVFLKAQEKVIQIKRSDSTVEGPMEMTFSQHNMIFCKTQIQRNPSGFCSYTAMVMWADCISCSTLYYKNNTFPFAIYWGHWNAAYQVQWHLVRIIMICNGFVQCQICMPLLTFDTQICRHLGILS